MKLKTKLALGLSGLLIGLTGVGCPLNKPHIKYYTDKQEIQNRFVYGDNVDVSQALNYNPIPNKLGKAFGSYLRKDIEKSLESSRTIYVQYNGTNNFPYYSSLENAVIVANTYGDTTEIQIGKGIFGNEYENVITFEPMIIKGNGNETVLRNLITEANYLELSNLKMEGSNNASLVSYGGVKVENVLFEGENSPIILNAGDWNIIFENNTMINSSNKIYPASITMLNIFNKNKEYDGSPIIRYNEIKNTPVAIQLETDVNAGVQGNLGNNLFLDVDTVVYNPYNYPQGFVGNAWAVSNP